MKLLFLLSIFFIFMNVFSKTYPLNIENEQQIEIEYIELDNRKGLCIKNYDNPDRCFNQFVLGAPGHALPTVVSDEGNNLVVMTIMVNSDINPESKHGKSVMAQEEVTMQVVGLSGILNQLAEAGMLYDENKEKYQLNEISGLYLLYEVGARRSISGRKLLFK